jgi:hypothetical protein
MFKKFKGLFKSKQPVIKEEEKTEDEEMKVDEPLRCTEDKHVGKQFRCAGNCPTENRICAKCMMIVKEGGVELRVCPSCYLSIQNFVDCDAELEFTDEGR